MSNNDLILGWDVGGTKCAAVVGDRSGAILERSEWPTKSTPGHGQMIKAFLERAHEFSKSRSPFSGVGVSIGGPLNMRSGVILAPPHLPDWDNVPLKDILTKELAPLLTKNVAPIIEVLHDAAACLAAETIWGGARGSTHAIYLTCATGCGSGIMVDGRILMGPNGESAEIGFAKLADNGPAMDFCGISQTGHTEIYGSGTGISRLATYLFPKEFPTLVECKVIADRARNGNCAAQEVFAESARRMGQLCVTLATLFSPQFILIGSLARYLDPSWLEGIIAYFKANSLATNSKHTVIKPASLGERLQDLSSIAPVIVSGR